MSTPARRRPTIKDVAERAGVSRSTTSRALTQRGYVAASARERVLAAASELRYVPDVTARNLKQQFNSCVGLLVSDLRNTFYAELASGAGLAAQEAGFSLMLADDRGRRAIEMEVVEQFVALRVAGVVVTPLSAKVSQFLRDHDLPVVEVDRQFDPFGCDAVVTDNRLGARQLARHLLDLGHRHIVLLIDELDWTTGQDRRRGFLEALDAAGVPSNAATVVTCGGDADAARTTASALLRARRPPTAIFAANNVLAEGAWRAAQSLGYAVPAQLSIVSFDDAPWMSMVSPGVTAIRQDAERIGWRAVARLLARLEDPSIDVTAELVPTQIVIRGSTTRPPASPGSSPR